MGATTFLGHLPTRCGRTRAARDALLAAFRQGKHFIEVDLGVLAQYNARLHELVTRHPNEYMPVVRCTRLT